MSVTSEEWVTNVQCTCGGDMDGVMKPFVLG